MATQETFRVAVLGPGAIPGYSNAGPLSAAMKFLRKMKRQGRTTWVETAAGVFHPVKGATRKPAHR